MLEVGLDNLKLQDCKRLLILELGAGSILKSPEEREYSGEICAVEIDPVVLEIAREHFDIARFSAEVIKADAGQFLQQEQRKFNLIIVDLFIDDQIPDPFLKVKFWQLICDRMATKGQLLFNLGFGKNKDLPVGLLIQSLENYGT